MSDDDLETTHVVTVFLRHDAEVLLFQRSDDVGSYSGQWGAVAGHAASEGGAAEDGPNAEHRPEHVGERDPIDAAHEEIREETGLDPESDVTLTSTGDPFDVLDRDLGKRWVVHPFLFGVVTRDITTNYETAAYEWVPPTTILRRGTVPDLWTSYDRVRPTVETVREDCEHGSAYLSVRALEVLRDEAALAVERGTGDWADLAATARALRTARPSMPVVENRVNRAMDAASAERTPTAVESAATDGIERALAADDRAAARAAEYLPSRVATVSRSGTVLAALERREPEFVLVAESRPGREGVGTAEAVATETDASVTVTTDAAFGEELAAAEVDALVVGADAIMPDGRVVNKVGTRAAACVATTEGEVYVVAASDKVVIDETVVREEREASEVYDGDVDIEVANPTFGVTPADCVDSVITEDGVLDRAGVREVGRTHREWADWHRPDD